MKRACLAAVVAAALVVSGCTKRDAAQGAPVDPAAKPGGTVTIGMLAPRTVAPWLTTRFDPYGSLVVSTMCDPLLDLDARTGELRPALAESFRRQDTKTMVLKLRDDARFPDGDRVTIEDVAASLARVADGDNASPAADVVLPIKGAALLAGLRLAEQDERDRDRILGAVASNDEALTITLEEDRPDWFRALDHPLTSVVSEKAFKDDPRAVEMLPQCAGPYRLERAWAPGQETIRLLRNGAYAPTLKQEVGRGRGYADVIEFHIFPDREAAYAEYAKGGLDAVFVPEGKLTDARSRFAADLVTGVTPTVEYIGLPMTRPPFDSEVVRRALAMVLDRKKVAEAVSGGLLTPATRLLPPTLGTGFSGESPCSKLLPAEGDIEGARRALAEKDIDLSGRTVELAFNDELGNAALVTEVGRQWTAAFGLQVALKPMSWEAFQDAAKSQPGFLGAFRFSQSSETSDPTPYLAPLFESKGARNYARFRLQSFDKMLKDKAQKATSDDDRVREMTALEFVPCVYVPLVPVVFGGRAFLVRSQRIGAAHGVLVDRTNAMLVVRDLYVR